MSDHAAASPAQQQAMFETEAARALGAPHGEPIAASRRSRRWRPFAPLRLTRVTV
jgi:hypothetical protein